MIINSEDYVARRNRLSKWRNKFAWLPVRYTHRNKVWLDWYETKSYYDDSGNYVYQVRYKGHVFTDKDYAGGW